MFPADKLFRRLVTAMTLIVLLFLIGFGLSYCHQRNIAREARDAQTVAEGRTESAVEAITEIGRLNERGLASDADVKEAQNEIAQADPADRDRIARYHLCRLQHRADCERVQ